MLNIYKHCAVINRVKHINYVNMADSQLGSTNSSKTMKIDKSSDIDEGSNENKKIEEKVFEISSSQVCAPFSKPILAGSKLAAVTNNFLPNPGSVLKPSFMASGSGNNLLNKSAFALNPSKLNPFAKVPTEDDTCNKSSGRNEEGENDKVINGSAAKFIPLQRNKNKQLQVSECENDTSVVSSTTSNSQTGLTGTNNFVFGQNIKDRVVTDDKDIEPEPSSSESSTSNGISDMLFTYALKGNLTTHENKGNNPDRKQTKSLSESAREYEEARAIKRKYEEVEVKTGEEGETNVVQISCKLFAYDKSTGGSWQERGRGTLRLNDQESGKEIKSRLVFRTSGSLRVVLNTKIWSDMNIQQASEKSIRLTAFDNGNIRVFLVMGNQEDIRQLYRHLELRIKRENDNQHNDEQKTSSQECSSLESNPKKIAVDSGALIV
ncbi:ran-binding protein 3 isoform X1 [Agrilus planipennis]|uniref:Ran-binding protein 3 isoform X1 n=1 Tax=Agrilus planipennis TaxID=224129 RepID=A0A1W4XP58_AGRPL|nr:ran-binding protein 3 isoform X1 [Agrilus planipennis]